MECGTQPPFCLWEALPGGHHFHGMAVRQAPGIAVKLELGEGDDRPVPVSGQQFAGPEEVLVSAPVMRRRESATSFRVSAKGTGRLTVKDRVRFPSDQRKRTPPPVRVTSATAKGTDLTPPSARTLQNTPPLSTWRMLLKLATICGNMRNQIWPAQKVVVRRLTTHIIMIQSIMKPPISHLKYR